ncbi:MAG: diguanylate cyclase [Gammaproteobacteria bacterium]|nr:diguanylate cyclase [Gammaproteobacteria bacterium]
MRVPGWREQRVQLLIRYLFLGLAWLFFNHAVEGPSSWVPLAMMNALLGAYFVYNTANLLHARYRPYSLLRYRAAMWVDIFMTAVAVLADPHEVPPTLVVFIMIVLGNGMRYGMRMFGEAVVGAMLGAMTVLSLRYSGSVDSLSAGVLFLNLLGAIILIYAYILMSRVERSRLSLEEKSRKDALTGLMNRHALFEIGEQLFDRLERGAPPMAVMFADLDKFKQINDTLGHTAGDQILARFAELIRGVVRKTDVAARYGGDEFVLLLPDTDLTAAEHAARRLQRAVASWAEGQGFGFSVSIGLGEAPTHGTCLATVLQSVDRALYDSKAAARAGGGVTRVGGDLVKLSTEGAPA